LGSFRNFGPRYHRAAASQPLAAERFAILGRGALARNTLFRTQKSDYWNERPLASSGKQGEQRLSALQKSVHFGISSEFLVPSVVQKCGSCERQLSPRSQRAAMLRRRLSSVNRYELSKSVRVGQPFQADVFFRGNCQAGKPDLRNLAKASLPRRPPTRGRDAAHSRITLAQTLAQFQQKNLAENEIVIMAANCSKISGEQSIGICIGKAWDWS
jgi:hypothetical protein